MNILRGIVLLLTLWLCGVQVTTAVSDYRIVPDSIYNYTFNRESNQYVLASINHYYYGNGLLDSLIVITANRVPVTRTVNNYSGEVLNQTRTYVWKAERWVQSQNQEMYYDEYGHLMARVVTQWKSDHWENLNTFTYYYDENDRLVLYHRDFWINNTWTDFSADSLFYGPEGYLAERSARLTSSGEYLTRILYAYGNSGLKLSQTRQDFLNSAWVNAIRTSYLYNDCGTQVSIQGEKWLNGNWEKDSRSDIFYHYEVNPGVKRVPVCRNGRTVYVLAKYLVKYLALGDCLGECSDQQSTSEYEVKPAVENKDKEAPFIVFPNPAKDYITVKITDSGCLVARMELLDYYGRTLRSIDTYGQEMITLDIGSLAGGNYILRVFGDTVYSLIITKR